MGSLQKGPMVYNYTVKVSVRRTTPFINLNSFVLFYLDLNFSNFLIYTGYIKNEGSFFRPSFEALYSLIDENNYEVITFNHNVRKKVSFEVNPILLRLHYC
jgi:hypothetical protein